MSGTATYKQTLSDTMRHNVDSILNNNKSNDSNISSDDYAMVGAGFMGLDLGGNSSSESSDQDSAIDKDFAYKKDSIYEESIDGKNKTETCKITWRPWTTIYDIEIIFHGRRVTNQEAFEINVFQISKVVFEENYIQNFASDISVIVSLTGVQLLEILDNYRELRAHVYIRRMSGENEYIDYDNPIVDSDYLVIIKDKELRKRINKESIIPKTENEYNDEHQNQLFTNVEFQLISEKDYKVRHTSKFHFIATECTIKDAIIFGLQQCDIQKASIVEPDNKTVYKNLVIPPQQTFSSFILFLQEKYGIYDQGVNYYLQDDIMYIYPLYRVKYDEEDKCPETTHFYCIGNGNYEGMPFYHAKDQNNMYHIVINKTPVVKDMVDSGIENVGEKILFHDANRVIDVATSVGDGKGGIAGRAGGGEIDVKPVNTHIYSWEPPGSPFYGITNTPHNVKMIFTANQFKYKSELQSYRNSIIAFQWNTAEPRFIRPGYTIKWHIDGEDYKHKENQEALFADTLVYQTYDGIVQHVTYTLQPGSTPRAKRYPFSCMAEIAIAIDCEKSDKIMVDKKTEFDSLSKDTILTDSGEYSNTGVGFSEGSMIIQQIITDSRKNRSSVELVSSRIVMNNNVPVMEYLWSDNKVTYGNPNEDKPVTKQNTSNDFYGLM